MASAVSAPPVSEAAARPRVEDPVLQPKHPAAHRASELADPDRAVLDAVGEQDEKLLVVIGGAAQMVGELDEHQGLNTTQVSLPGFDRHLAEDLLPVDGRAHHIRAGRHVAHREVLAVERVGVRLARRRSRRRRTGFPSGPS